MTEKTLPAGQSPPFAWQFSNPHVMDVTVSSDDIDVMGHTNNVVYLDWLQRVAWSHSGSLGMDWKAYQRLDRAMVARRHELDYLGASFEGDQLSIGTWIAENDQRLSILRRYQIIRNSDRKTLLDGCTRWVCVALSSGKPKRMPKEFVSAYGVTSEV